MTPHILESPPLVNAYQSIFSRLGRTFGSWRLLPTLGRKVVVECFDGQPFHLDLRDKACVGIFLHGFTEEREQGEIAPFLSGDSVCLDIGANVGVWARFLAQECPDGKVYSFEPSADTYKLLAKNTASFRQIETVRLGCGSKSGLVYLSGEASSDMRSISSEGESIELTTIDEFCADFERLDFIKIDVEGTELDVLKGGADTIKRFRPTILFEFAPGTTFRFGYDLPDLEKFFNEYRYSIRRIPETNNYLASK